MEGIYKFTSQLHSHPSPSTDPCRIHLPAPFAVCVVGASRSIGASIAITYAKAGASTLIIAARSTDDLQGIVKTIQEVNSTCRVLAVYCDVAEDESVERLAKSIGDQVGRLDVVVVNSGTSGKFMLKITDGDPKDFQKTINTNLVGTYHVAHHLLPLLLSTSGGAKQFIAIGTIAAWITNGPNAHTEYTVSKLAQARVMEIVAEQYKDEGLLAVTLHPGGVASETALKLTPKIMHPMLVDDVGLGGAFCVWLSSRREKVMFLSGRFLSANWDVDELLEKEDEIIQKDLLKIGPSLP